MLLRILHTTTYRYQSSVDLAQHMVHLSPLDTPGQQVLAHSLHISPAPAARSTTTDVFGNQRTFFSLQAPHETLTVQADSLVQTGATAPLPQDSGWPLQTWERVCQHLRYRKGLPFDPASEFLFASPHVPRDEALAAFARPAFAPGQPLLEAARALMERVHTELHYETASTDINTPVLQALAQRKGVCQDFAHLMIGCLRSLGLPARYVSGYLLTRPPPGQPRLIGADASHAWVAVYVPRPPAHAHPPPDVPGLWFHFDPTNNRCGLHSPGEDYVQLASGRDFSDVSPMRGVIHSGARHTLEVAVTVAPQAEWTALSTAQPGGSNPAT